MINVLNITSNECVIAVTEDSTARDKYTEIRVAEGDDVIIIMLPVPLDTFRTIVSIDDRHKLPPKPTNDDGSTMDFDEAFNWIQANWVNGNLTDASLGVYAYADEMTTYSDLYRMMQDEFGAIFAVVYDRSIDRFNS